MATPYEVGIHLSATNGISSVLAIIAKDVLGLHASVAKLQAAFIALNPAIIGAGMALAGTGMLKIMSGLVEKGNEFVKIQKDMAIAGATNAQVGHAVAAAWELTGKNKNLSASEILKTINDARGIFGDQDVATHEMPEFVKAMSFLKAYDGGKHGGHSDLASEINAAIKSGEISGKIAPEEMKTHIASLVGAKIAFGEQVKVGQYLTAQRAAGAGARGWDDDFRYGIFSALVQENGQNAGTMSMTAFNKIIGGQNRKSAYSAMDEVGILDREKVQYDQHGHLKSVGNGAIKGDDIFYRNPQKWVDSILRPAIEKVSSDPMIQSQMLSKMFPDRNAAKFITELLQQGGKFHKDAALAATGAKNYLADDGKYVDTSLNGQMQAFREQWNNFMTALGSPMVENATKSMKLFADNLNSMLGPLVANSGAVQVIGSALGGVAAGLVLVGTALLGGALLAAIGPVGWLVVGITAFAVNVAIYRQQVVEFIASAEKWRLEGPSKIGEFIVSMSAKLIDGIVSLPGLVGSAIAESFAAIGAKISAAVHALVGVAPGDAGDREGAAGAVGNRLRGRPVGPPPGKQSALPINNQVAIYVDGHQLARATTQSLASYHEHPTSAPYFDGSRGFMSPDGQFATV